jgi:serine/threonine protein kinase
MLSTVKGTVSYMAPELFGHEPGGSLELNYKAADMWSLGEMVYRMLTKTATFPSHGALFRYLARPDLFPSQQLAKHSASELVGSFIRSLMKPSPDERLHSDRALDHDWIQPCRLSAPAPAPSPIPTSVPISLSLAIPSWNLLHARAGDPRTYFHMIVNDLAISRMFLATRVQIHGLQCRQRLPACPTSPPV